MLFERIPRRLGGGRDGADGSCHPLRRGAELHALGQADPLVEVIDGFPELTLFRVAVCKLKLRADGLEHHQKHPFSAGFLLERKLDQGCRQLRPDDQLGLRPFGKLVGPDGGFEIHTTYWNSLL